MWTNRALEVAREAKAAADRTEIGLTRTQTLLESHVDSCGKLAEALRRDLADREARAQEWRVSLGARLDAQDELLTKRMDSQQKLIWQATTGLVLILLTVVGFFVQHLKIF